jgi:hypothetical protein
VTSNEQAWIFGGPDAEVDVVVEPLEGHTADEVAQHLRDGGASDVAVLSPSYVSARATRSVAKSVESMATVAPKATKRIHRLR